MKQLVNNWKTSSIGITLISGSIVHLVFKVKSGHSAEGDWNAAIMGIVAGLGMIFAGDASATQPPANPTK